MAIWLDMLVQQGRQQQEFLAPAQLACLISPLTVRNAAEEIFYGIGWDIDTKRRIIYHDGRTAGQSTRILFMPHTGFGIVILCNQQTELQNLMVDFERFVVGKASAAASSGTPLLPAAPLRQQEVAAYAGTYVHPA